MYGVSFLGVGVGVGDNGLCLYTAHLLSLSRSHLFSKMSLKEFTALGRLEHGSTNLWA